MTSLSPAAQAVLTEITQQEYHLDPADIPLEACRMAYIASAVLRVAADQVAPEPLMIVEGGRTYEEAWTATVHDDIRRQLLTIAAELEALQ
jgi:hypothetical protein